MRIAFTLLALLASIAQAAPPSKADAIIAAYKAATGGAAWDKAQGCHEEGHHGGDAIHYTTWFSLERYGLRFDSERDGKTRSTGFNGAVQWQSSGGKTVVSTEPAALAETIISFYLSANGFFFPDRFPASLRYLREASEGGHSYDVLEVTPKGSRPAEIWFDHATHLLGRVVDTRGTPPSSAEADEYAWMGGFLIATRLTIYDDHGTVVDHGVVTSFSCGPIDPAIFDPPKSP